MKNSLSGYKFGGKEYGMNLVTEGYVGNTSFELYHGKISVDDTANIVRVGDVEIPFDEVRFVLTDN